MFFGGDPFDHFSQQHGGGMPGRGGRGGGGGGGSVDNESLYASLGVAKDADESEIKKAYKKMALKHHPDKGGDIEKVTLLSFRRPVKYKYMRKASGYLNTINSPRFSVFL